MHKDQKYQQVHEESKLGFRTFDEASNERDGIALSIAKKRSTFKVKVRLRASGLFDVVVYKPVPKAVEVKTEQK